MFSFRPVETSETSLQRYASLFSACFPGASHLSVDYLRWLYTSNPCGRVVGMDAMVHDVLAAHYVCIPVDLWHFGTKERALLSLNTATHPSYQGKGLFTKLAEQTYELGRSLGAVAVFGVANANSTPGFIRKLKFQLVAPLEARIGVGHLVDVDWKRAKEISQFRRAWSIEQLSWRMSNPSNPLIVARNDACGSTFLAKTGRAGIRVWGDTPTPLGPTQPPSSAPISLKLFLGMYPRGAHRYNICARIPGRFRPSPLNLIYRNLESAATNISADRVSFNFLDFDAY
jgi:GNAT superfamily N-acetyltransferase